MQAETATIITGVNLIDEGTERHDFGVTDAKGRQVGASIRRWVRIVSAGEKVWHCATRSHLSAGTWYALDVQATRADESFGPVQPVAFYATEAERIAAADKYLAGAKKRAVKQFPQVAEVPA